MEIGPSAEVRPADASAGRRLRSESDQRAGHAQEAVAEVAGVDSAVAWNRVAAVPSGISAAVKVSESAITLATPPDMSVAVLLRELKQPPPTP